LGLKNKRLTKKYFKTRNGGINVIKGNEMENILGKKIQMLLVSIFRGIILDEGRNERRNIFREKNVIYQEFRNDRPELGAIAP
jgi:hypothetical protein